MQGYLSLSMVMSKNKAGRPLLPTSMLVKAVAGALGLPCKEGGLTVRLSQPPAAPPSVSSVVRDAKNMRGRQRGTEQLHGTGRRLHLHLFHAALRAVRGSRPDQTGPGPTFPCSSLTRSSCTAPGNDPVCCLGKPCWLAAIPRAVGGGPARRAAQGRGSGPPALSRLAARRPVFCSRKDVWASGEVGGGGWGGAFIRVNLDRADLCLPECRMPGR